MRTTLVLTLFFGDFANLTQGAELDKDGGFTNVKGETAGFFHTQKIGGRHFLIHTQRE